MADEIKSQFGESAELIKGRDGVFEVEVEGALIFSKKELGRFPEPGELDGELAKRLTG